MNNNIDQYHPLILDENGQRVTGRITIDDLKDYPKMDPIKTLRLHRRMAMARLDKEMQLLKLGVVISLVVMTVITTITIIQRFVA